MLNKRGAGLGTAFWVMGGVAAAILLLLIILYATGTIAVSGIPTPDTTTVGFDDAKVFNSVGLKPFNYIFGNVPQYLINWTNGISAGIIIIGLWVLLFVTFGDVLSLFSIFSRPIAWVIALVLTIMATNLKILVLISVYAVAATAGLGTIAIFVSLIGVFVIFVAFNFGTETLRGRLIMRRAQDKAMRAVAGGKVAASAITVLKDIAKKAEEGEKK